LDPTGETWNPWNPDFWTKENWKPTPKKKVTYKIRVPKPDPLKPTWDSYMKTHKCKEKACDALLKAYELAKKNKSGKTADHLGKVIAAYCVK
jgi:hypothetical protein